MLEGVFAENFSSPYYPVLADIYLEEGDLMRARKVCEIGLDHDSANVDGKFILSKISLVEEKFTAAEKLLKQIVVENPSHFTALRMLIKLEFQLKRSTKTIWNYLNFFSHFFPKDNEYNNWLEEIKNLESDMPNPNHSKTPNSNTNSKKNKSIQQSNPVDDKPYQVVDSMATFSMLQVLKSQNHYLQALSLLNILESKSNDKDRISKERREIQSFLNDIQSS